MGKKVGKKVGRRTTAEQVTEEIDARHLTIIVTGGTHGLGKETVRVLAKRGAHVYIAARNLTAAEKVKGAIIEETPHARIDFLHIDLASLESVRTAAKEFLALNVPLNVLVCNTGVYYPPIKFSVDGVEMNFATNYLGHVLLTHLLLNKLKEAAKLSAIEGRIVNVSSHAHQVLSGFKEGILFDEICRSDKRAKYQPLFPYNMINEVKNHAQSKLAQILYTKELANRLQAEGVTNVTVNSLHPGSVRTNLPTNLPVWMKPLVKILRPIFSVPVNQGARTQTYLAISHDVNGVTGKYFDKDITKYKLKDPLVRDEHLQQEMWDFSMKLISAEPCRIWMPTAF